MKNVIGIILSQSSIIINLLDSSMVFLNPENHSLTHTIGELTLEEPYGLNVFYQSYFVARNFILQNPI